MLYAIFGIPLTLYTLANLGLIMATAFRFLYKYICCGLCCLCCPDGSEDATTIAAMAETVDDDTETPGGAARRAVLFLRGGRRHRHVDVATEFAESAADSDDDDTRKTGWRQKLDAVFAETIDINEVSSLSLLKNYIQVD